MRTIRHIPILFVLLWSLVLFPTQALAQTGSLTCDIATGGVGSGEIYDTTSLCQYQGITHIFSQAICQFVTVINDVLSNIYCGMQFTLKDIVGAVFTLYIAVFGAQMLMGTVNLSAKEFLSRVIKIALVWVFVTESMWGIGIAFTFFITLATDGIGWVMNAVMASLPAPAPGDFCYDDISGAVGAMTAFTRLDYIICSAVSGPFTQANSKVVGFFIALSVAFWPIGMLIISWIIFNFKVMASGLITFLLGIASIAFLIAMSPIFLSLMLFRATYQYFETWLRFLISFTLQIIIVFGCIALWMIATAQVVTFFNDLSNVIFPLQTVTLKSAAETDHDSWGVCPFTYNSSGSATGGPSVTCQGAFDPVANPTDRQKVIPPSMLIGGMNSDADFKDACKDASGADGNCSKFIYYIIYNLITLIIICYAFEALLREAPKIAVYLAGPEYSPMMGQGFGVNRSGGFRMLGGGDKSANAAAGTGQKSQSFLSNFFGGGSSGSEKAAPQASGKASQEFRERTADQTSNRQT